MAQLGDFTVKVKVDYEMTETSLTLLRDELRRMLSDPDVLRELLKLLTQESRLEAGIHDGRIKT